MKPLQTKENANMDKSHINSKMKCRIPCFVDSHLLDTISSASFMCLSKSVKLISSILKQRHSILSFVLVCRKWYDFFMVDTCHWLHKNI